MCEGRLEESRRELWGVPSRFRDGRIETPSLSCTSIYDLRPRSCSLQGLDVLPRSESGSCRTKWSSTTNLGLFSGRSFPCSVSGSPGFPERLKPLLFRPSFFGLCSHLPRTFRLLPESTLHRVPDQSPVTHMSCLTHVSFPSPPPTRVSPSQTSVINTYEVN